MEAVLRVRPVPGETTWSFLHRVAAAYRLQAGDLTGWWRWVNPAHQARGVRPDGEVFLDAVAQAQLAGWCRVPAGHLAWALPSWGAGLEMLARYGGDGRGWVRWRTGATTWGPVVFGCRLCTARRGGAGVSWVYRARWQRLCTDHDRWLLDVGDGHLLEGLAVGPLAGELARAQRQWACLARTGLDAGGAGGALGEVFALARAVVCGWWELEAFGERERVWGRLLEQVVAATGRREGWPAGWGMAQWRLLARDAVVFPDVVAVACALADPRLQHLAAGGGRGQVRVRGAARGRSGGERVAAELGRRLGRPWLREVEAAWAGPLSVWAQAMARARSRPVDAAPGPAHVWWVRSVHRPVEVGPGLRALAGSATEAGGGGEGSRAGSGAAEPAARPAGAGRRAEVVPRRSGHGGGLKRRGEQLFTEGLEQARAHVARHGHLALAHTGSRAGDGFDLGRWLAGQRVAAASLTAQQTAWLQELDPWWNPPWPLDWQRAWYRARDHVRVNGPVHGGDNLAGVPRRLERWLRHQITHYRELHEGQRQLLADLGLGHKEVEQFHAWPGRRRPAADGLAAARAYAARHGHLAVSSPTTAADGFALGRRLAAQRVRQHTSGHPTRLGRTLTGLDAWWNPPWPVQWQRMWWAARYRLAGLPDGCQWWPGAPETERSMTWLRRQRARRVLLHPGQQQLLDALPQHTGTQTPALTASPLREVSDQAWALICPLIPRQQSAGGRWREHRLLIDGIAHTARTDTPWRDLPAHYGPWQTCYRRYKRWLADGTLHQITALTLPTTDHGWQIAVARRLHRGG